MLFYALIDLLLSGSLPLQVVELDLLTDGLCPDNYNNLIPGPFFFGCSLDSALNSILLNPQVKNITIRKRLRPGHGGLCL